MKAIVAAVLVAVLVPVSAHANDTLASTDIDAFRTKVATITVDASVAGQWIILLPAIAQRCALAVREDRVTEVVNTFSHPELVDEEADYYAEHPDSRLKASWDAILANHPDAACRLASGLWGESGRQFPGVLDNAMQRDRGATMRPVSPIAWRATRLTFRGTLLFR